MDRSGLDKLRVVAETAAYLRRDPGSTDARRRRNEAIILATRDLPDAVVADAARLSIRDVRNICGTRVAVGKRSRKRWFPIRHSGARSGA